MEPMNSNVSETEVLNLINICSSFPESLEMEVPRENMVSTLVGQLKRNTEIIVVEGEEGIGKTTLMSQFARAYPNPLSSG
jgi:ABC-type multidrug transport system ATPase subunit